ncbi:MAG: response regulator, partial [Candidatus Omnitrophica bacterium]|nr:response regulator [Candidatus Omnitrophota bacterium]
TLEAQNGEEAVQLARSEDLSVVLLDMNMPGMDGLATLEKLKKMNDKLGVVMITGDQDDEKVKKAIELGAYGYVLKPFDFLYLELVVLSKLVIAESG